MASSSASSLLLPASWAGLLEGFRPAFRRRGTFTRFVVLATGMIAQTGRRSVVGMLSGARMAQTISFHAACRFFSAAVWDADRLGLLAARLIVERLLAADAPIVVVVDDTLFKRWGRTVHHAFWTHDGAAQGGRKTARGNRWVIAGIVVRLPFCTAPVCLPVLFRLWAGKGTTTPVELAAQLLGLLAAEFGDRVVHGVGDAAYHGKPLLVAGTTWTTRLPANAALYDLAPPRTGRRGRPALKGAKLGTPAALADRADWQQATVHRYGRVESVWLAEVACLWYGSFGNPAGRCVLVRDDGCEVGYDLALFTFDHAATPAGVVERYAVRWSVEPANATGKQQLGVGQARNRLPRAVERTVPFGMLTQSLVICWYALYGHHPEDVAARRLAEPWYDHKTEPSFQDMLAKLRRTLIAARLSAIRPGQTDPGLLRDYALACAAAAA
jgi:DDE superfamily endonuclease